MIAPGTTVAEGQPVMELETDKAVVEVPSSVAGTVKDVLVRQGEKIKVGQVIFTVENGAGGKRTEARAQVSAQATSGPPPEPAPGPPSAPPVSTAAPPSPPPPSAATEAPESTSTEFKLPELGENIHQGDLVRLLVSPGTQISAGEPVMELETDKAVVEVPSSVTGIVKDVLVKQGEKIKVGQVIFTLNPGATPAPNAQQPTRADQY